MSLTSTEEAQLRDLIAKQAELLSLATAEPTIISKLGATKKNISTITAATVLSDADLMFVRQGTQDKSVAFSTVKIATAEPDSTETVKGVAEIATQLETETGIDDTKIITPKKMFFGCKISIAQNGYLTFPWWLGKFTIQWGTLIFNATPGNLTTVNYPKSFTTSTLITIITPYSNSTSPVSAWVDAPDGLPPLNNFGVRCNTASLGGRFFAIGV